MNAQPKRVSGFLRQSGIGELARTVVIAFLIAILIRTLAFEPFNIPSGSMIPTLEVGDNLFISKYSYGYSRYSFPFGYPPFAGRVFAGPAARGDVVVFKLPRDNKTDYIKRVIGVGGDRVQMKAGRLWINEEIVPRTLVASSFYTDDRGRTIAAQRYQETLPGPKGEQGAPHLIQEIDAYPHLRDTPVFTVPPGHYFVMGDNRDNSSDSRVAPQDGGVGFVPEDNLEGRAQILFFSIKPEARWWEVWNWPWALRFSRILAVIT